MVYTHAVDHRLPGLQRLSWCGERAGGSLAPFDLSPPMGGVSSFIGGEYKSGDYHYPTDLGPEGSDECLPWKRNPSECPHAVYRYSEDGALFKSRGLR